MDGEGEEGRVGVWQGSGRGMKEGPQRTSSTDLCKKSRPDLRRLKIVFDGVGVGRTSTSSRRRCGRGW